jgi:O-antigen ligase
VIGVGPGNFDTRMGRDFEEKGIVGAWLTAHNTPIQVLVELGLAGGVVFGALVWTGFRAGKRLYRSRRPGRSGALLHYPEVTASMAAFCASSMFLSQAYSHLAFFVFAFGGYAARVFDAELGPPDTPTRRRGR